MKREEKITDNYLKSLGYKNVVFEPDGNIPPDFSIDGRIAVEVRRLNQHFFTEDEVKGLEEGRIPLFNLLQSCFSEFDAQYKGSSYWVLAPIKSSPFSPIKKSTLELSQCERR